MIETEPTPQIALETFVEQYVADYEMRDCEDEAGNSGDYQPTENDRAMITDAIHGLIADRDFTAFFMASQIPPVIIEGRSPPAETITLTAEDGRRLAGLLNAAAMKIYLANRTDALIPQLDVEAAKLAGGAGPALDASIEAALSQWLARELPPGTSIHNPKWWAPRLLRFVRYAERAARG